MNKCVIGIDPGQSGGIAMLVGDLYVAQKMPDTERGIYDVLLEMKMAGGGAVTAFIEKVHSFPGQGVASTWKFGQNYGALRMALAALSIPMTTVAPGTWQKSLGCLSRGNKNVTKIRAQELYPEVKVTHAIADALLIATYGFRNG